MVWLLSCSQGHSIISHPLSWATCVLNFQWTDLYHVHNLISIFPNNDLDLKPLTKKSSHHRQYVWLNWYKQLIDNSSISTMFTRLHLYFHNCQSWQLTFTSKITRVHPFIMIKMSTKFLMKMHLTLSLPKSPIGKVIADFIGRLWATLSTFPALFEVPRLQTFCLCWRSFWCWGILKMIFWLQTV